MISLTVSEHNSKDKTVIIEAYQYGNRLLKSPMKYKTYTKKAIEKLIAKGCKAFTEPQWGGYNVIWLIDFE